MLNWKRNCFSLTWSCVPLSHFAQFELNCARCCCFCEPAMVSTTIGWASSSISKLGTTSHNVVTLSGWIYDMVWVLLTISNLAKRDNEALTHVRVKCSCVHDVESIGSIYMFGVRIEKKMFRVISVFTERSVLVLVINRERAHHFHEKFSMPYRAVQSSHFPVMHSMMRRAIATASSTIWSSVLWENFMWTVNTPTCSHLLISSFERYRLRVRAVYYFPFSVNKYLMNVKYIRYTNLSGHFKRFLSNDVEI